MAFGPALVSPSDSPKLERGLHIEMVKTGRSLHKPQSNRITGPDVCPSAGQMYGVHGLVRPRIVYTAQGLCWCFCCIAVECRAPEERLQALFSKSALFKVVIVRTLGSACLSRETNVKCDSVKRQIYRA